jgi:hypothetical protein
MPEHGLMPAPRSERLSLPQVTLCAVSSSNVAATLRALETSLDQISFAEAILFTHADPDAPTPQVRGDIRVVPIERLTSAQAYSQFMLTRLVEHAATTHCLVVQWDGHVIDAARWRPEFLDYDYIGASWPQFDDGRDVGNGGFSLRSRRLLQVCRDPRFTCHHPEDLAICRTNRALMDELGMRFAPKPLADAFAAERAGDPASSFGYHGVFLMPRVVGPDAFWQIYRTLDERSSLWRDLGQIGKALQPGARPYMRRLNLTADRIGDAVRSRIGS